MGQKNHHSSASELIMHDQACWFLNPVNISLRDLKTHGVARVGLKNKWFSQETLGAPIAVRRRTTFPMLPLPVAMAPAVYPQTCGSKNAWSFWNTTSYIKLKGLASLILLSFFNNGLLPAWSCMPLDAIYDGIGPSGFAVANVSRHERYMPQPKLQSIFVL